MLDALLRQHAPLWYRTPYAQTVCLGLVFFLVFTAYTTIQFYASSTYGATLAANSVSALYLTFTLSCFVAPTIINEQYLECRMAMLVGIVGGYAMLVVCSLAYFVGFVPSYVVVLGGAMLGVGAALLWTAQGTLILQYAAAASDGGGKLFGAFWAVFQCSSLVGGSISFAYYYNQREEQDRPTGSVLLYLIFLAFILLGAVFTQFLLPPSMLLLSPTCSTTTNTSTVEISTTTEHSVLVPLEDLSSNVGKEGELETFSDEDTAATSSWNVEATNTLQFFISKPMLTLSVLFFYTGFNQPYQQATFSRFFTKRSIGLELILFHVMEIAGGISVGRALDDDAPLSSSQEEGGKPEPRRHRQRRAVICLLTFAIINLTGNILAFVTELNAASNQSEQQQNNKANVLDISNWTAMTGPSIAFMLWGFADSQIQVYCYWLIGSLYSSGEDHSRAVGFYKCVQSMGYTLGFYLIPTDTRLSGIQQLLLSTCVFVVGILLAFLRLPPAEQSPL